MRDMRLLIFQLHPPVLETEGLVAALRAAFLLPKAWRLR
jgi:signal transduction histidine kinase